MLARLPLAALAALAAAAAYGFFHESLGTLPLWMEEGARRFLDYLAGFAAVAGLLVWLWPRQLLRMALVVALLYAGWWAGPLAPLAVVYFLGSCGALGRRLALGTDAITQTLVGAAVWMTVLWCALHFRVNFGWSYALAFGVPYLLSRQRPALPPKLAGRGEAAAVAVLVSVLGAHLLVALKPEISSDGLAMHLALPAAVAQHGVWGFDHRNDIWALMPAGADALFTGVFLLGGEAAAKLLNFAFLGMAAWLVARGAWRWTSGPGGYLAAALFVSTPLAQLVTGSLFVENVWAAFIAGATLAVLEGGSLTVAVLAGAAVGVKLIAAAFGLPLMLALLAKDRADAWRPLLLAALVAVPPYVFAYAKSGNPIFPFANALFRSPDYHTAENFRDTRYADLRPGLSTPYDLTFRSGLYIEGDAGGAGFQYFLLLLPAALAARRREQWLVLGTAAVGGAIVLLGAPNLRYLYAAMPLASMALAWGPGRWLWLPLVGLNLWFLPAAGYYDRDFALFRKSEIAAYVEAKAPARLLIERLNREAPGEPVAFLGTDATAGLAGRAYTSTWHSEHFWQRVRDSEEPPHIAAYLRELGIRYVVAPVDRSAQFDVVQRFLQKWLDPEPSGSAGVLALYRLRDTEIPVPKDTRPLVSGRYDNTEPRIEYMGAWLLDPQFPQPYGGTLHYSSRAGDVARVTFAGSTVRYVFTRAANRGIAEVWVDGALARRVNLYAPRTEWQAAVRLDGFTAGVHTLELRVTGRKDARSAGTFVDLDAIDVE